MQPGPRVGPYSVTFEVLPSVLWNAFDSLRVQVRGIPRLPGDTPAEVAKEVLRQNAGKVLVSGTGHFWFLWPSDFGKAIRGALRALPTGYLKGQIDFMAKESFRLGRVTSCFSPLHGFDMPWYRGDNLPWLVFALHEYARWTDDKTLLEEDRAAFQWLLDDYDRTHFEDGLVARSVTGDWMDTVLRPSSTFNNLCALKMLLCARALGLKARDPEPLARRILEDRWRGDHFTDYAGTEQASMDAGVLALYFELYGREVREPLAAWFERSGMTRPFPMRVAPVDYGPGVRGPLTALTASYHSSIWLHMGLMYLNGIRKLGKDVSEAKSAIEDVIMRHGNVLESFDPEGRPYRSVFLSSEYGLTMAAGQYLELALG